MFSFPLSFSCFSPLPFSSFFLLFLSALSLILFPFPLPFSSSFLLFSQLSLLLVSSQRPFSSYFLLFFSFLSSSFSFLIFLFMFSVPFSFSWFSLLPFSSPYFPPFFLLLLPPLSFLSFLQSTHRPPSSLILFFRLPLSFLFFSFTSLPSALYIFPKRLTSLSPILFSLPIASSFLLDA
jgi:hypothetical protein